MCHRILSFLILVLGTHASSNGALQGLSIEWTHHVTLPGEGEFQLKWNNKNPEWITMEMRARTTGYVGIGFSPKGGMPGADIVIGWVDGSGTVHLKDYHGGAENGVPIEDPHQDYEILYGSEVNDETIIVFRRKWDTCDSHDMKIGDDTLHLIWAWHPVDPSEGASLHHHGFGQRRGVRSIYMRTLGLPAKFPDDDPVDETIKHWDIQMYNVEVPKTETKYLCKIIQFPQLHKKHQIIGYRPLISTESEQYIHHINIANCHVPESLGKTEDIFAKYLDHPEADCISSTSPYEWKEFCYAFRVAVGVGAEGDMYPTYIGDPIGNGNGDRIFLRLEVHYENPYGHKLMDSSGIRVFYTDQLRQYDLAVLFAGHRRTPFLSIPPFQSNFRIYGYCGSECTQVGFPNEGIKVFSVLLHAHLRGRKLILRHIRKGKELEPLAYDNHFDFNYQEYRKLTKEVTILPGDELIMECEFETKGNHSFILGGLAGAREMCEAFIYYYPKSSLTDCRSQPEYYSYLKGIGITNATGSLLRKINVPYDPANFSPKQLELALPDDNYVLEIGNNQEDSSKLFPGLTITSPRKLAGENLMSYMHSLDWKNSTFAHQVEKKWKEAPRYMHCSGVLGNRISIPNPTVRIGQYVKRKERQRFCKAGNSGSKHWSLSSFLLFALALGAYHLLQA